MEIQLVENDETSTAQAVETVFAGADEARVAVAYARKSGLEALPTLENVLKGARSVRFLAGVDFQLTDLDTLERLHAPPEAESRVFLIPAGQGGARNFHPKIYVGQRGAELRALVGSANFTAGGLRTNVEASLLIKAPVHEPVARQILDFHNRLWTSPFSIPVSASLRQTYSRLQRQRADAEMSLREEVQYEQAKRQMELAVSEAIVSDGGPHRRRSWLMVTSPENYILCERKRIWGDERQERLARIHPGDILFFYIKKLHQLGMMAMVTGGVYEDGQPYWEDRPYPYRMPFTSLADPGPIGFRPLIPRLDLFKGMSPSNWGQALQRAQILLTPADARLLASTILTAAGLVSAS